MLTDASTLREEFRLPPITELPDPAVEAAIVEASRYVQRAVDGDDVTTLYDDAQTDWDDDPEDLDNATLDLQRAEKHYAMYLIIMRFGVRFRRDGFVKKQQDAASPATSNEVTNEFWSQKEIEQRARWYKDQAIEIINDYSWNLGPVSMGTLQIV